jgi:hypothetical protein
MSIWMRYGPYGLQAREGRGGPSSGTRTSHPGFPQDLLNRPATGKRRDSLLFQAGANRRTADILQAFSGRRLGFQLTAGLPNRLANRFGETAGEAPGAPGTALQAGSLLFPEALLPFPDPALRATQRLGNLADRLAGLQEMDRSLTFVNQRIRIHIRASFSWNFSHRKPDFRHDVLAVSSVLSGTMSWHTTPDTYQFVFICWVVER